MSYAVELFKKDAEELLESASLQYKKNDEGKHQKSRDRVKSALTKLVQYVGKIDTTKNAFEKIVQNLDLVVTKINEIINEHLYEDKMMIRFFDKIEKVIEKNKERLKKEIQKNSDGLAKKVVTFETDKLAEKVVKKIEKPICDFCEEKCKAIECGHYFHKKCLVKDGQTKCPTCKKEVKFTQLQKEQIKKKASCKTSCKGCDDSDCDDCFTDCSDCESDSESESESESENETDVFQAILRASISKIESSTADQAKKIYKALKARFDKLPKVQKQKYQEDIDLINIIFN